MEEPTMEYPMISRYGKSRDLSKWGLILSYSKIGPADRAPRRLPRGLKSCYTKDSTSRKKVEEKAKVRENIWTSYSLLESGTCLSRIRDTSLLVGCSDNRPVSRWWWTIESDVSGMLGQMKKIKVDWRADWRVTLGYSGRYSLARIWICHQKV